MKFELNDLIVCFTFTNEIICFEHYFYKFSETYRLLILLHFFPYPNNVFQNFVLKSKH